MKHLYRLALLLPLLAFRLLDWQFFTLDKHLTVELPTPPTELDLAKQGLAGAMQAGTRLLMARTTGALYQLMSTPSADVNPAERTKFYDGIVAGLVTNQGHTLVQRSTFATPAGDGIDITFRTVPRDASPAKVLYNRCVLVNRTSYILGFMPLSADTTDETALRRRYFNSMIIKP
ncbi:hypothetical protein [Hymenobacter sp. BT559]|uniref:hypothetical protein n=1 Tax=Hymenobacter sp. BT559 TaxID=2795729 RepID=UPI0018EB944A|nr:hypothetical protein [Hymenobacter sp. BT559]MBJ6146403.1 hypothetical protein [Hymenobacter sp. BT559]